MAPKAKYNSRTHARMHALLAHAHPPACTTTRICMNIFDGRTGGAPLVVPLLIKVEGRGCTLLCSAGKANIYNVRPWADAAAAALVIVVCVCVLSHPCTAHNNNNTYVVYKRTLLHHCSWMVLVGPDDERAQIIIASLVIVQYARTH